MQDIKTLLKNLEYTYNRYGKYKKLITLSNSSLKKIQKAGKYYNISESYIIDLLIEKML